MVGKHRRTTKPSLGETYAPIDFCMGQMSHTLYLNLNPEFTESAYADLRSVDYQNQTTNPYFPNALIALSKIRSASSTSRKPSDLSTPGPL